MVVLTRQMTMDPPPLPPDVPAPVSELVFRMLAKDPDARPQTAGDVVAWIDGLFGNPAALSPTPSPASVGTPSPASVDRGVQFNDTVLSMQRPPMVAEATSLPGSALRTAKSPLAPLFEKVPALARTVDLGGQRVPIWGIALAGLIAAAGAFVLIVVLAVASRGGSTPSQTASGVKEPAPDLAPVIKAAETGDRQALAQLQARPETERTAREWRAIGRGLSVIGHVGPSLSAYDKALGLDPALAKDRGIVRDVRKAAETSAQAERALDLAVQALGATGADLVYDV